MANYKFKFGCLKIAGKLQYDVHLQKGQKKKKEIDNKKIEKNTTFISIIKFSMPAMVKF